MSTLQINNIRPYSGNTLTISGSFVDVPGVLTVETSITSSGDTRFPNVGTGVVNPVSSSLAASGTSSLNPTGPSTTNTTTFLDYGVNVIEQANAENYCVKLPSTPTKGKEITIVNLSGLPIHVFPGVEGGSINGIIGNSEVLPPDGIAYKFTCWENPLPGGWSIVSPPSPNGVVQSDIIGGLLITQSVIPSVYVNNFSGVVSSDIFVTGGIYTGMSTLNAPNTNLNSNLFGAELIDGSALVWATPTQSPETAWKKINSITVYTNLQSIDNGTYSTFFNFSLTSAKTLRSYNAGTFTPDSPVGSVYNNFITNVYTPFSQTLNLIDSTYNSAGATFIYQGDPNLFNYTIPGTFTPIDPIYVPLSSADFTGYLSANPGDPGTTYYTMNIDQQAPGDFGKGAGLTYLGTTTDNFGSYDMYFLSTIGLTLFYNKELYIDGLKIKFVIDYESL